MGARVGEGVLLFVSLQVHVLSKDSMTQEAYAIDTSQLCGSNVTHGLSTRHSPVATEKLADVPHTFLPLHIQHGYEDGLIFISAQLKFD